MARLARKARKRGRIQRIGQARTARSRWRASRRSMGSRFSILVVGNW